ncbi:Uma2 family endonuclease [Phaeodactylibacter luteus]|uniref:Uma2 family endonuclease n=1 Tax=Phaeodactylibacter luteus TaxID=1564516 RepID=A0A5C6RKB9_9BACT|nr:Uma2 family endonuclease [Phaeodactylibacter luteus]TXB62836.1 Uma2 family endonuclease [Phaeodactylibacter luteus]
MITSIDQLDLSKKYTYADYLTWQLDEMVELIRGKVVRMSPAPGTSHQSASSNLHVAIGSYLIGKQCKLFSAPFDVRLPLPEAEQQQDKTETVVQPDLCIICDTSKLDDRGCHGAPDWIIEILSQSTAHKDLNEKFELYRHAGVQEYWVVHPAEGTVLPYRLDADGQYALPRSTPYTVGDKVPVGLFPGFEVELRAVFG